MINITVSDPLLIDSFTAWHSGNFDPYSFFSGEGLGATVYLEATSDAGQLFTQARDTMIYENIIEDSHTAYDTLTGVYTAPVSGKYLVNAIVGFDISQAEFMINGFIYVNGVEVVQVFVPYAAIGNYWLHTGYLEGIIHCLEGDTIEIKYWVSTDQYSYPVESINRLTILKVKS